MSVRIHWRPTNEETKYFKTNVSDYLAVLECVFPGKTIPAGSGPQLRAMAEASGHAFYNEVAEIVETAGEIEFWGKW